MIKTNSKPLKPAADDSRDFRYADKVSIDENLPEKVDLRAVIESPIIDQGLLNSCSACALSTAVELHLKSQNESFKSSIGTSRVASAMFIYYNERFIEGIVNSNAGVHIKDGFKSLAKNGVCSAENWPYQTLPLPAEVGDLIRQGKEQALLQTLSASMEDNKEAIDNLLAQKPSEKAVEQANRFKSPNYHRLDTSQGLTEVRHCLANGIPVVFGIMEPESFFITPKSGMFQTPPADEFRLGGHALLAVGYDDEKSVLIARNSYGPDFGEKGYCYLSYDFVSGCYSANGQSASNTFDFWCLLAD